MSVEIKTLRPKREKIAFAFSSKERTNFSEQSIAPLLAEKGYDVYWIDGSSSDEGKTFPFRYEKEERLCEIHTGVRGGADAAIVYSLSLLLDKGYEYIGLVENDVKLEAGWWPRIFDLFEEGTRDGLIVGGVSARCYMGRIHVPRNGYALMCDLGAGQALYTREAVECILDCYRTGLLGEIAFYFGHYTGHPTHIPWQQEGAKADECIKLLTADWYFQTSMIARGLTALAPTPTLATKLDPVDGSTLQETATQVSPKFDWAGLCQRLKDVAARPHDPLRAIIPNYNPVLKNWRAFPHQYLSALPNTFRGSWKLKWSKMHGPFAMVTAAPGASLHLAMHGKEMGIMLDSGGRPLTLTIRGKFGEGKLPIAQKEGWQWANICFPFSGPFEFEVTFDNSDVQVAHFVFEGPQPWFKSAYGLRYAHLKPYLE